MGLKGIDVQTIQICVVSLTLLTRYHPSDAQQYSFRSLQKAKAQAMLKIEYIPAYGLPFAYIVC